MPVRVFQLNTVQSQDVFKKFSLFPRRRIRRNGQEDLKDNLNSSVFCDKVVREKKALMMLSRSLFEKGDLVWFDPGASTGITYVLPGEVQEFHRAGQVVTVQAVINGKPQVFTLSNLSNVKRRQDLGQNGIEDMIQLVDLNEASLLWNLKIRYDKENIYTYVGSILVAVNPYKMFDIYGLDMVKKYEGQILGMLPPHLFAIGSSAYSRISKDGEDQVVIISGESGAGKTESTKLIMQYLAAVNKSPSNLITEQILEASPLLESFGNAKTVRNDNSSRFGKYLDVHFKEGVITGAQTTEYLLEKSRIVTQAQDERNYHVFYEMLAGLSNENKELYGLQTADKYFYLNQGGNSEIQCKYDGEDFQALLSAMQVLGFTSDEQETIWKILASVLHLGNVYFHKKHLKYGQEGVEIGSDAEVRWAAHLLQLSLDGIVMALTTKTTEARNERVYTTLNIDQALDARDAVAKALYSRLFSWLVQRINNIICKGTKKTSVAILDIFGFEDFKENSFEQLCINYANEVLQLYFNKHIFKLEQQEYMKEKIEWQTITFQDNQPVINLISKKPIGVLHVLDDESNFPKATDQSFLEKCHYNHALNELYSRPRMSSTEFGIKHYAGQVWYSVDGFLDKNRDTLRWDVVELLISSNIPMISEMFLELRSTAEAAKTVNKANGRFVTMKPRTPTVAARFSDSLTNLVESMSRCTPWFVRCIKPNNEKTPMKFDMPIVLEQLRYTGMMDTIRIRKMGYPIRLKFLKFADRYRCLVPGKIPKGAPAREICRVILDQINATREQFQLGSTKVFMRETMEQQLEKRRVEIVRRAAITIQKFVRGYVARKQYLQMRHSTVKIQAQVRGWLERTRYRRMRRAAIHCQATYRMKRDRRRYLQLKDDFLKRKEAERIARERAKAKAQRDEQERISYAVAGVNHLEIPAELAFIFSKLDDWQPPHSDRNVIKVVGNIQEVADRRRLPNDIDQHVFNKFTNIYFKSHIWGMKRDPIKTPFLAKNKDNDYQESLSIFKLILRFMNDNNLTGKKETVLGDYIVQKGLMNEKMRNEILCQLCNQTWKNDSDANNERGWILMANCLSCFAPDRTLFKYLLKYVSDHGYNGYKGICQRKLLQSEQIEPQLCRTYPPCMLEWKSNVKRTNMALEVFYPDGETVYGPVESWTTGEDFAANLLRKRGVAESNGWTLSLNESDTTYELNGTDYVLDLISELEIPPAFPVCKSFFLSSSDKKNRPNARRTFAHDGDLFSNSPMDIEEFSGPASMPLPISPKVQPPAGRISREKILRSQKEHTIHHESRRARSLSREHLADGGDESEIYYPHVQEDRTPMERFGLSKSKLNDRYHSMEDLLDREDDDGGGGGRKMANGKEWNDFGLATSSALNDRYFQQKQAAEVKDSLMNKSSSLAGRLLSEVSMNGHSHVNHHIESGSSPELPQSPPNGIEFPEFDFEDISNDSRHSQGNGILVEDDQASSVNASGRFVKSTVKKTQTQSHSHTTKAHIETRYIEKDQLHAPKSSALSDTSEAPSLASHVRRVRVPSQASDLDQYLDDLFNPVLEGNLDELSDARSLAASIKGGGLRNSTEKQVKNDLDTLYSDMDNGVSDLKHSVNLVRKLKGGGDSLRRRSLLSGNKNANFDGYINDLFNPIFVDHNVNDLGNSCNLAQALKGGGQGGVDTQPNPVLQSGASFSFPIRGMVSPQPMSGLMSPPPQMMVAGGASAANIGSAGMSPMFGGMQMMPNMNPMPAMNTTLPLYNLGGSDGNISNNSLMFAYVPLYSVSGFSLPMMGATPGVVDPTQIAVQHQMLQQQAMQLNAVSSQMQQMQQRAFLASAVQQNLQLQQHLMQQNQTLQHLLQQQQQQPQQQQQQQQQTPSHAINIGLAARTSSPLSPTGLQMETGFHLHEPRIDVDQRGLNNNNVNLFHPSPRHHEVEFEPLSHSQKVNFQDPLDRSWSGSSSPQSNGHPSKPFHERMPPFQERPSPSSASPHPKQSWFQSPPPMKMTPSSHTAFGDVLTELRSRRSSVESNGPLQSSMIQQQQQQQPPVSRGRPPPPPPPLPPSPPEAVHPLMDVFGRAKTVRIGKWRWPPPRSDDDPNPDNFMEFKFRQHQHKRYDDEKTEHYSKLPLSPLEETNSGMRSHNTSESSGSDQAGPEKPYDGSEPRGSAGSVGKLKISSEMRAKLEAVTLNHSVRSTNKNDARRVYAAVSKLKAQANNDGQDYSVRKLDDNRKTILQQKLAGRGMDAADSRDKDRRGKSKQHEVRSSVANFTTCPPPPPPPVAPPSFNIPPPPPPASSTYGDANSDYGHNNSTIHEPLKSPPRPISPSVGRLREVVNHRSERIEFEESSEYLHKAEKPPRVIAELDAKQLENIQTKLYVSSPAPYCTYARVHWTLHIRKEVFSPMEQLSNPLALHLVFCQVVHDAYSRICFRMKTDERQKIRQMLDSYGITPNNLHSPHHKVTIKKNIVDLAREWPTYFCRLFPVNGGRQYQDAHFLGVSHSGIYLVHRVTHPTNSLEVLSAFSFEDISDVSVPRKSMLQVSMQNGGHIILYTHKANQICLMIEEYCVEAETGGHEYVRAVADYVTRESTLLSFQRGDVIRVVHKNQYLEKGWLYGVLEGKVGIFPCEYVVPLSRNELAEMTKQDGRYERSSAAHNSNNNVHHQIQHDSTSNMTITHETQRTTSTTTTRAVNNEVRESRSEIRETSYDNNNLHWTEGRVAEFNDDKSDISHMTQVNDGKHSLLQFALVHFRQSLDKYEMLRTADGSIRGSLKMIESLKAKKKNKKGKGTDSDWTWKEQVEMVKYTKSPIQASLLKLESPELNKLALECFIAIMRYMGDYPMATDQSDVDCVYTVLINCHKHPLLRDEVYCQVMKQTTNNKSAKADSCQRGWRLFSIIAAYFQSSELLKPYLLKYLETAAYDKRRAYHGTAMVCLQNLRKTFKFGGRKNVPSIEEIAAISAGRNSKRQIYRLPGGTERVINTKSTSVVQDIIEEICSVLNVRNQHEVEEFSLYCIVEGDTFTMPLAKEEYILDLTTQLQRDQQVFYLIFCRSVWYYPLRLDNQLYIEVVFNQIAPDYLEGLLLVMPGGQLKQDAIYDLSRVAALLHRAAQMESIPTLKETKYLLPKPVLTIRDIKPPQWVNMVQSSWKEVERIDPTDAKAQVLEILQKWPLFGSSFFAIKKIADKEKGDFILALNRNGVHFLDVITHETLQRYPFSEVISTRKVRAEDGTLFLDMKCGNLMVQKITRIQTDQAHEISRLIRQYITIEQRNRGITPRPEQQVSKDGTLIRQQQQQQQQQQQ